jgi:hypothetical protein
MKRPLVIAALLLTTCLGVRAAKADSHERVVEVWTCSLDEGKTQEDAQAVNKKWLEFVNASVDGGDIHSYILTPIVGSTGTFLYADSYPSMEAWVAAKKAMESEKGKALDAEFEAVEECSSNALYRSTES